ncbi:MAG: V-type ATP synthase subunit D [Clostridiales bacterium]|nr:V-type ATP synthase subunit D [Clostridiales bacterium]
MNDFPTKANLMQSMRSLELAKRGYDLLDRKRNIMLREMLRLMKEAGDIRKEIEAAFTEAYEALRVANIFSGQNRVAQAAKTTPEWNDLSVRYRSVMGIEIPEVRIAPPPEHPHYGFQTTNITLDEAYIKFIWAKKMAAQAAALENSIFRLSSAIKQAKKRANALQSIVIPRLEEKIRYISSSLEERERDQFAALKVIKSRSK